MRLINSTINEVKFDNSLVEGRGRHFVSRFIEAGLVSYEEQGAGVLKLSKEALDRFVYSLVGCPVIIKHQRVSNENVDDIRVGVVSSVNYNTEDGWYWCDGIIWDAEAIKLIEQGWSVSCCYTMTESTHQSGEWHNMSYDDELINGLFEHLAIVPNPRYEEATILLNSKKEGETMLNIFRRKKIQNSEKEGDDMAQENEKGIDKNALKNRIMEHINKAVKGEKDVDGEKESDWYKDLREMLDTLAYSDSEDKKSNEKEEDKEEEKEEAKENACGESKENEESKEEDKKENSSEEDKKECSDDEGKKEDKGEEKKEEDKKEDSEGEPEKKGETKENSKGSFDDLKRLSNTANAVEQKVYMSEADRLELGKSLY